MSDIEKIKRHLGKPIPITLRNEDDVEDVFYFKPLEVGQQAILEEISKKMREKETIKVNGQKIPNISKEDVKDMFDLILDICKKSFPDLEEKILIDFTNNNFNQITMNLGKLSGKSGDKGEVNLIKQAREARKSGKETTA